MNDLGSSDGSAVSHEPAGLSPAKPRSGFARQKIKIAALERRIQQLQDAYGQLERDYVQLESAFAEIAQLNASLAGELQQLKQQRSAPVRYGANLMGM